MFKALCGKPWRWPPAVVCKLTDWQITELVFKRAGGRKKNRATRMPTREEYIQVGRTTFGGDAEALGREYDRVMGGGDGGQ